MLRYFIIIFLWAPICGFSFVFKLDNTKEGVNYRVFGSSIQNLDQNLSDKDHHIFEQAYEAFLRSSNHDQDRNQETLEGEYHYSQRPLGSQSAFSATDSKVYTSRFIRFGNGKIQDVSGKDIYPIVRSVPVFPTQDVPIGGTWEDDGVEVQDFALLGFHDPFIVPFHAQYQYVSDIQMTEQDIKSLLDRYKSYNFTIDQEEQNRLNSFTKEQNDLSKGKHIAVLSIEYHVDYKAQEHPEQTNQMMQQNHDPVSHASGYYKGLIFWDKDEQEELFDIGVYDFTYQWNSRVERRWSGKEYGFINLLKQDGNAINQLAKQVKDIDHSLEVKKEKRGVNLILGDLLFHFNKTTLRPNVIYMLEKVTKILEKNPTYVIHITGHSDNVGDESSKQRISNGRAENVANFFVQHGIDSSRITFKGVSDSQPRIPNTSVENRRKNRRVELYIITE